MPFHPILKLKVQKLNMPTRKYLTNRQEKNLDSNCHIKRGQETREWLRHSPNISWLWHSLVHDTLQMKCVAEKGINETLPDRLVCPPPGLLRGTAGVYYYNYYYNYYYYYYYSWCLEVLSGKVVTGARLLLLILLILLLSISANTTIPPLLLPIQRGHRGSTASNTFLTSLTTTASTTYTSKGGQVWGGGGSNGDLRIGIGSWEGQIRDQTSRRLTHSLNLGARCHSKRNPRDYD